MAKKILGKIVTLAALGIVATTAISYILKYKSFHKDLEDDFFEFEDEDNDINSNKEKDRNYIALSSDRDNFVMAAKDTFEASKGMAGAAKDMLKDVGNIIVDNTSAAARAASDMGKKFTQKSNTAKEDTFETAKDFKEDVADKTWNIKEDVADKAQDIKENAEDKAHDIKKEVTDKAQDFKDSIEDMDDQIFEELPN